MFKEWYTGKHNESSDPEHMRNREDATIRSQSQKLLVIKHCETVVSVIAQDTDVTLEDPASLPYDNLHFSGKYRHVKADDWNDLYHGWAEQKRKYE